MITKHWAWCSVGLHIIRPINTLLTYYTTFLLVTIIIGCVLTFFFFFCFEGVLYEQMCGVAMGSPIVANLFMEYFESKTLASSIFKPKLWKRLIDDTCTI